MYESIHPLVFSSVKTLPKPKYKILVLVRIEYNAHKLIWWAYFKVCWKKWTF